MKRKVAREYTIKGRVLIILMGLLIPLVLFIIFYNWFAIRELNKKIAESSSNTLYIQCQNLVKTMNSIENAMVNITSEQPAFRSLAYGPSGELENYDNTYETCKNVTDMMYSYSDWWGSILICVPKKVYRIMYNRDFNTNMNSTHIQQAFEEMMQKEELPRGKEWYPIQIDNESYLIRTFGFQKTYLIAIINLHDVYLMQNNEKANEAFTVFFDDNYIYTGNEFVDNNIFSLDASKQYQLIKLKGREYMAIPSRLEKTNLTVAYVTPSASMINNLSKEHIILLIISISMILVIPVGYQLLKHLFFSPLDCLINSMEQIKMGSIDHSKYGAYKEIEFRKVDETLYSMVKEIRQLKIEAYEKELKINKTKLEFYQIQIRPHFYLNCLKHIYGMVELKKYADVQKTIVLLSRHLRYMLTEVQGMVPVSEELQYIKNYIELQQSGNDQAPICEIICSEEAEHRLIPAISLLSFVENSIKYGYKENGVIRISVIAELLKTEEGVLFHLNVSDNGQGYEPQLLKQLNFGTFHGESSKQLGIQNVIQRFRLQYGERVTFAFSNYEGAIADIFIKEKEENESVNCG